MDKLLFMLVLLFGVCGYLVLFYMYITGNRKKSTNSGYDITFKLLEEENNTKIVEGSSLFISEYDCSRDAIRLSTRSYNNKDSFTLFTSSLLAGFALCKNSSFLNILKRVFRKYRFLSFSPLLILLMNIIFGYGDSILGILITLVILFYQYLYFNYLNEASLKVEGKVNDNTKKLLNTNIRVNILFMMSSILLLIKFIWMML